MALNKAAAIAITALITTLVVGGVVFLLRAQRIAALEQQVEALESANAALEEQISSLQEQLGADDGGNGTETEISRAPSPGWEAYFPTAETTTLLGEPVDRIRDLLGEPPVLLRSIAVDPAFNREIWIYMPAEEDPTGLYIFFKGNRVSSSRLDEFPGLYNSGLLDDAGFWVE